MLSLTPTKSTLSLPRGPVVLPSPTTDPTRLARAADIKGEIAKFQDKLVLQDNGPNDLNLRDGIMDLKPGNFDNQTLAGKVRFDAKSEEKRVKYLNTYQADEFTEVNDGDYQLKGDVEVIRYSESEDKEGNVTGRNYRWERVWKDEGLRTLAIITEDLNAGSLYLVEFSEPYQQ